MQNPDGRFDEIRRFYNNKYYVAIKTECSLPWHCRTIGRRFGSLKGRALLDVACGTGEWLAWLHQHGARSVTGIDLSEKAIQACRQRLPQGEFYCCPAEELPFPSGAFDIVTCMGSLEHFLDKLAALKEMRRVLKPGGFIVLLVPNAGFLTRRLGLYGGTQQQAIREDVLSLGAWHQLFSDAGLRVEARWRDLHPLSRSWILRGSPLTWPARLLQALALTLWPIRWQYQVYHRCSVQSC
ncbi:methyltransferase domain-containing protein [Frateuria sp. MAH-13]|uniref:Methyltransferase domain-containing protein n=1 Tax=Frateuria flava TaxID=2821489 RepID=A0ABS4DNP7_9GAMM|nr:class I SAM-dependent methyltransferase [Frateuria flava]MBP1474670.1 methyltransferase domain-containing protein [Frateuria flava]